MTDPTMVSRRAQIARLRRVAVRATEAYPLRNPILTFIAHGENTTFRVDDADARFLLRVHRPERHGRGVDSAAAVGSEMAWLEALSVETDLRVPIPVRTRDGAPTVTAADEGVAGPRVCSLLRWLDGRIHYAAPRPAHLRLLGAAMAGLHDHAARWRPPAGFVRMRWDWETFFGNTMVYGGIEAAAVWQLLPADIRRRFDLVAARAERVMADLGTGADAFGLIHADLHLENALFHRGEIGMIDFDDCGHGHWMYDIAVPLWDLRRRPNFPALRDALIDGYRRRRDLPADQLAHLDDFIAIRDVAFGLWFAGTAQVNPAFRDDLDETLAGIAESLDTLSAR